MALAISSSAAVRAGPTARNGPTVPWSLNDPATASTDEPSVSAKSRSRRVADSFSAVVIIDLP